MPLRFSFEIKLILLYLLPFIKNVSLILIGVDLTLI